MSIFSAASGGTLAAGDVLNSIKNFVDKGVVASKHLKTSSLSEITSIARVEPIALIDTDSFNSELVGQALQCAHNISVAQYLQAISLMGNVGSVNVIKTLDKLNPNRKPDASSFITEIARSVAEESFQEFKPGSLNAFNLGNENFSLPTYALEAQEEEESKKEKDKPQYAKTNDKGLASVAEMSNLSVGKLINVTITNNGQSLTIPISFRLLANEIHQSTMLKIMTLQGLDRSFKERYWKWRAGRIGFISDLILMRDLVKADKAAMMNDKTGVLDEMMKRAKNNKLAGFFSKNASMNEAANIVVFSEETARQLKLNHNVDVDNFKQRQHIFEGSYAFILVKIDREWERVTFYLNGQALGSSLNKSELKSASNKSSGTDLVEIFQALKKSESSSIY